MRQLMYISSVSRQFGGRLDGILTSSRRNNLATGLTGLLYTDEVRFLQVLEGDAGHLTDTFDRIKSDFRHYAIVVLSDKPVERREFGLWSMAHKSVKNGIDRELARLTRDVSANIAHTFLGLNAIDRTQN